MKLEKILRGSIPEESVFGYLTTHSIVPAERNRTEVTIRAFNRPNQGLTKVEAIIEYPWDGKAPASTEEVRFLAAEMGGDYYISMNYLESIMNGKFHPSDREEQIAAERYRKKDFYLTLFQLVGIEYEEIDEKLFISLAQPHLQLTSDKISAAYSLASKEGLVSGVSNGGLRRSFGLYQFAPEHFLDEKKRKLKTSLHLSVGEILGDDILRSEEIDHLEQVVNSLGYRFFSKNIIEDEPGLLSRFLLRYYSEEFLNGFGYHFISGKSIVPESGQLLRGSTSYESSGSMLV